jgi:precorrin-6A/cobalt-precorrin-6A reductase
MILLLGGTSDTAPIATRLAQMGHAVLVSRATSFPLDIGTHSSIQTRCGPLDEHSLAELMDQYQIRAIVDATHPYATTIRTTACRVARERDIPYLSFLRTTSVDQKMPGVEVARDHASAALAAFQHGRPVLLTTGTRNLTPYVAQAQRTGIPLVVRVLDQPDSIQACRRAGLGPDNILACRGPFSVAENRQHIRAFHIGALVSKDSGTAGGTPEKLEAARAEACAVIIVARPALEEERVVRTIDELLQALAERFGSLQSGGAASTSV